MRQKKLCYLVCCIRQNVKMGERGAGSIWFVQDHHFECVLLTALNIVFPSQNHDTICWKNHISWLKVIRRTEVFLFFCFICWRPCCGCGCAVRACVVLITRNASLFCPLPNLSYLALKIAHYSFIALKDCPSCFLFRLFPLLSTDDWVSVCQQVLPFQNEKASSLVSSNRFPGCWYLAMNEWSICTFVGCVVDVDQNCVACVTHIAYLLLFEIVLHVFVDRTRWVVVNCPWETIRTCRNLPKTERHMQKALFWHILRLVSPDGKHFTQMKLLQQISHQNLRKVVWEWHWIKDHHN